MAVVFRLDGDGRTCKEARVDPAARHGDRMPGADPSEAYGVHMTARAGGRSPAISWIVGVLCAAVVGALLWLSLPAGPGLLFVIGRLLDGTVPR